MKFKTHIDLYLAGLAYMFGELDRSKIEEFLNILLIARENGNQIFFIGNGGSASTANHFATDLDSLGFRTQSLAANSSVLTAIGNDFGYENVFSKQLYNHLFPGDVVVAISASGNSPNIVKAITYANNEGAVTVGLTGFDGGCLKAICQTSVHVPSSKGEYGPVEDIHLIFDHMIMSYLKSQKEALG